MTKVFYAGSLPYQIKNTPNVSPKEIFNHFGADKIIIANIASAKAISNILSKIIMLILSFIGILVEKDLNKGIARIVKKTNSESSEIEKTLTKLLV